jgi:prephenate dehydrogenase
VVNALEEYILNLTNFKELLEKDKYEEVYHEMQNTNRIKEILR